RSSLVDAARLGALAPKRSAVRCGGCGCACALTVVEFEGSRRFVSGNRCERAHAFLDGAAAGAGSSADRRQVVPRRDAGRAPNVVALERKLLARFGDVAGAGPRAEARVGLMDALNAYENLPFWHTLLRELGFSVLMPRRDEGVAAAEGLETIPSESVCQPAKVVHARFYDLAGRGARAVLMPRYERGSRCPVSSCYADAVRDSVPLVHEGAVSLVAPTLGAVRPEGIACSEADRAELLASLGRIAPEGAPLGADELEGALEAGLAAQRAFEDAVARATERALAWVHAVPGRHGAVLAGRPYHVDAALSHEVDGVVERLGLAVLPPLGLAGRLRAAREARSGAAWPVSSAGALASPPWKPAKRLVGLARFVAEDPSLELVCLRSFGCGFDALGADEARDVLEAAHRSFTVLKIDDIVDTAHLRIRLRTLAEAVEARDLRVAGEGFSDAAPARTTGGEPAGLGGSAETAVAAGVEDPSTPALRASAQDDKGDRPCASSRDGEGAVPLLGRIGRADLERARVGVNPDVCHTVASLAGRAARLVEADPSVRRLSVPRVCERCLLDALPRLVERACGRAVEIEWEDAWPAGLDAPAPLPAPADDDRPRIGILGNALLCFDAYLNDGLVAFVERLGCRAVLPDPANLFVDDVRYGAQLDAFEAAGVDHVVYLQSFGCLKGHVHARGALHEAARRHPNMPVTVVDYDPEASALNRENRIRLAVAAAHQARAKRPSGA
ncbi:acyl-CoA dehydratase activase-related protein, partial [Gordonibacter massiliensis (ex Traore et al. 2017)]